MKPHTVKLPALYSWLQHTQFQNKMLLPQTTYSLPYKETFLNDIHKQHKCLQNFTILCFQYFTISWSTHTGITAPGLTPTILTAVKRWGRPHCPVAGYRISGLLSIGCSTNVSVLKGKQQNYRLQVGVPILCLGYSHIPYQHQNIAVAKTVKKKQHSSQDINIYLYN